jgi:transposase
MEVTHFVLQQAWCPLCAQWTKAQVPPEHAAGYGPRLTACIGEIAGTHGTGRRTLQTFCASVLQGPLSLGAIQTMLDRVAHAIGLPYDAIARQARQAPVNYIDETPWFLTATLQWLGVIASDTVALYMIHCFFKAQPYPELTLNTSVYADAPR